MNKVRGKILKKLKSVGAIGYLRDAEDGVVQGERKDITDDKENVGPTQEEWSVSETEDEEESGSDEVEFRRPRLSSRSLFDRKLLSAFRRAVEEQMKREETEREALGGVILYTTSLRGVRKTFENCNSVRFLLETFRVDFVERDISMHMEFREELRRVVVGEATVVPPKLFVKGRYIGGAEEVLRLHEQGRLRPLLEGLPVYRPCGGCAGHRFLVCFACSGSRRRLSNVCHDCNENGLLVCPLCC